MMLPIFKLGETVYQKNADERYPGIVNGLMYRSETHITYFVRWPDGSEEPYMDFELSREWVKDYSASD